MKNGVEILTNNERVEVGEFFLILIQKSRFFFKKKRIYDTIILLTSEVGGCICVR